MRKVRAAQPISKTCFRFGKIGRIVAKMCMFSCENAFLAAKMHGSLRKRVFRCGGAQPAPDVVARREPVLRVAARQRRVGPRRPPRPTRCTCSQILNSKIEGPKFYKQKYNNTARVSKCGIHFHTRQYGKEKSSAH